MYQPMLYLHWKQVRLGLLPLALASFALPLLSVQGLGITQDASVRLYEALTMTQVWLPVFPALAAITGMTLALSAWNWDHQGNHVYALSLPLSRWQYAGLKMGAGAVLALVPAAAFWLGAHLAVGFLDLPATLNAYPNQLALRFFLAIMVAYGILFAMAAGTMRTTLLVLTGLVSFLVLGTVAVEFMANFNDAFAQTNLLRDSVEFLAGVGGPFEIFTGNWALIDV